MKQSSPRASANDAGNRSALEQEVPRKSADSTGRYARKSNVLQKTNSSRQRELEKSRGAEASSSSTPSNSLTVPSVHVRCLPIMVSDLLAQNTSSEDHFVENQTEQLIHALNGLKDCIDSVIRVRQVPHHKGDIDAFGDFDRPPQEPAKKKSSSASTHSNDKATSENITKNPSNDGGKQLTVSKSLKRVRNNSA